MKKTLILIVLTVPLLLFSFILPQTRKQHNPKADITDTAYTLLAAYGKYIYQRENCARCHTYLPEADSNKISLENIAGKYPDSWHYNHLDDPRMMMPGSKMPRFKKLFRAPLNYKIIIKLLEEGYSTITEADSTEIQNTLEYESATILHSLKRDEIVPGNPVYSEAIAIIAWLQYRPDTPEQHRKDSVKKELIRIAEEKEKATIDSALLNKESSIYKLATSKDALVIEKGKKIFSRSCAACHQENAGGMVGPNLTDDFWLNGNSNREIFMNIYYGVTDRAMPAWRHSLDPESIALIIAYIHSVQGTHPPNGKAAQGKKTGFAL